jgi:hypothetical protein
MSCHDGDVKWKRGVAISGVCALICAAVIIAWRRGPKEPEYQGKKLSEWGYEYRIACARQGVFHVSADDPATVAIRAIGTNAVPLGFSWLKHRTPKWKQAFLRMKCPTLVQSVVWNTLFRKEERAANGIVVFLALGPEARSAIPELVAMIADPAEQNWMGAVVALEKIGPEGFLAMEPAAEHVPRERAEMLRRIARNVAETATNANRSESVGTVGSDADPRRDFRK